MPDRIYSVSYKGRIYDVRAPESADPERIYAVVRAQAGGGTKPKEAAGFLGSLVEGAQTLGLSDEATAFAANPTEATRRALIEAGESKYKRVGFGEGDNWEAFKQALGGSLGEMLAPAAAGLAATPFTSPIGGLATASAVSGTQYTAQNLLRQAQEQERAIQEGRAPGETSVGKALVAATGQTALDVAGGRVFSGISKAFPFMRPLLGQAGGKAAKEATEVIADAASKGTISFVGGVAKGVGKGVAFEVPQEVAQSTLERWQAGLSLSNGEALNEYKQAAIGAAVLGGTFGGVSGALSRNAPEGGPRPTVPPAETGVPSTEEAQQIDEIAAQVLSNPEDAASFTELTTRLSTVYGIPEEQAKRLALGAISAQATPPSEAAAPEATAAAPTEPVVPPTVIPPIEEISPQAQVAEQLAEVMPPTAPAEPVEVVAPVPTEVAPAPEAIAPAEAVAPEPVSMALPDAKKKVTPERISLAKEMLTTALQMPDFEGLDIAPKEISAAAQQMARTPGLEAPAALANVLGIDTAIAQEDAFEAAVPEMPAPEMAAPETPAPEVSTVEDIAVPEMPVAEAPVAEEVVEAPAEELAPEVPVTKVAPGVARGVKPVQRGSQGTQRGRPVEGAAQLTEGMKAQQGLTAELEAAREALEISDADVAATLDVMRAPATDQELKALPPERRNQWLEAIRVQREVDAMQERVNAVPKLVLDRPNPERADLEQALGGLQQRLDTIQKDIVGSARQQFEAVRTGRRDRIRDIRQKIKSGKVTPAEERALRTELRESTVSRAEVSADSEATELAAQAVEVAKREKAIRPVIEFIAQQDSPLGELARRLLPIVPNVKVAVVSGDVARMMARNPGERPDDIGIVDGVYVPKRKTIYLTNDMAMDHTPVHEVLHPIIDGHIITGTPEGREITAIYDMFKTLASPEQVAAYGFTSAREFTAEVWSNQKFRNLLRELTPTQKVETKNLLQRVGDAIKRIFRKMLKSEKNAAPVTDYIERVMQLTEAAAANPIESEAISRSETPKEKIDKGLFKAQQANKAAGFTEGLDEAVAGAKLEGKERREAFLESLKSGVSPTVLKFQPTSWIRDGLTKMRPGLGTIINAIDRLEQNMRGMRTSMERAMRRRAKEFERFVNQHGQAAISTVMTIARINRVDVTAYATRAEALEKDAVLNHYRKDENVRGIRKRTEEVNTAWDAWEKLGKQSGGHETYKMVRQFYKDMYTALRAAQDEDIRNLGLDKEATNKLIRLARGDEDVDTDVEEGEVHAGVPEKLFPKEYFPFRRFGEHVLIVQVGKRTERERYHFESARERNEFEARRAKELGLKRGSEEYNAAFKRLDGLEDLRDNMSEESFLLSKLFGAVDEIKSPSEGNAEDASKFKKNLKDKLYQTYLMTLPERNLRKQFIHAELVTGQSADALRVFKVAASQYVSQLPKVVYGNQIQTQIEAAYDSITEGDPAERSQLRSMLNTIVGRTRGAMDPDQQGKVEQVINEFTFLSLMTSIASAAVQPLTIPFQVLPRMVSRYGPVESLRMLGSYTPLLSIVQTARETDPATGERWLVAPTLGNVKYIQNNPLRARLWKELDQKRDLFSQKQADMLLRNRPTRGTTSDTLASRAGTAYSNLVNGSGALFSSMDQITRELSGMSFAELEYNKLRKQGKDHEAAIAGAVEASVRNTNETIGNYTEAEKLDVFRGNALKRMLGFLRTYSVQRTAYYFRMFNTLYKGDPTQTRLQAANELSMVLAFTALGAGVGANFGYEFICDVIDFVLPAMLDDDEMEEWRKRDPLGADDSDYRFRFQWLPEQFGPNSLATRIAQRGVLSEFSEWDWTTRLSQSSLWIRDAKGGDSLRDDIVNFLIANLAPQVSQSANIIDGIDEFTRGNWSKGFTKIMPAAVRGAFTAERYATEGETTKSNYPVMGKDEFSTKELVGQVLGFTPNELSRIREINRTTQAWQRSMDEERKGLFEEYRTLLDDPETTQGDISMMIEKVLRYNAKVPLRPDGVPLPNYVIEPRDIMQSLRGRATREKKSYRGVEYAPGEGATFFPYEERKPVPE